MLIWRTAGACDCGPLSCTKIERPSPLEKPSCKVRLFAQNRSRKYRPKVTVTTLSPTTSHPDFQLLPQTAHVCLHSRKRVHTRPSEKDRTQVLTGRNRGVLDGGAISTLGPVCTVRKPFAAWCQNGKLCRFLALAGGTLEERRGPAGQRCAYARRCPAGVAAPLGCVILFRFCRNCGLYALRSGAFRVCEVGGGITTLGALCVLPKRWMAACQSGSFAVF